LPDFGTKHQTQNAKATVYKSGFAKHPPKNVLNKLQVVLSEHIKCEVIQNTRVCKINHERHNSYYSDEYGASIVFGTKPDAPVAFDTFHQFFPSSSTYETMKEQHIL